MPAEKSAQLRSRLGSPLVALVSGLCGLFAALPGEGCAWHEGEICPIDEVERVLFFELDSLEVVASESYPELVGATVFVPPDDDEHYGSSLLTMTWTVDEVVHSVTWRIESFSW